MPSNSRESRESKEEDQKFHLEFARQMVALSTAGFGLAAALAWNSLIQGVLDKYVKKYLGGGELISMLIYAIIVTVLAVVVTLQLSRMVKKLEKKS